MVRAGAISWCVVTAIFALYGQQPQTAAHVLDLRGEWRLDGASQLVVAGEGLIGGSRVTAASNQPGDAITIVRDEDLTRTRIVCDGSPANPCRNPTVVQGASSAAGEGQSRFKGLVQAAIAALLSEAPAIGSHYASTLTRGLESVQESEAVVALDPTQGIVLPPAPAEMPAGRYTISIARVGDTSSASRQTGVLTSEGEWRPLLLESTGLYEVSIVKANEEQVADLMLLVVPLARLQAQRETFDAMKSRAGAWTGPSARADEHRFLRGYLLSVNQP